MPPEKKLPAFIAPMLARSAEPFDAPDVLFEIKWDGIRALAFVDADGYRILSRRRLELTGRYPELEFFRRLEPGTVLDGEIVVLSDGKPDFSRVLSRQHSSGSLERDASSVRDRATFIAFDQLYAAYRRVTGESLGRRRSRLSDTVAAAGAPGLVFSDGIVGEGKAYFEKACDRGLEGVMAKRLDSRYDAGRRSDAWLKIKRRHALLCAIIGYVPAGAADLKSLIVAADDEGELRFVGKVGSGLTDQCRGDLLRRLRERPRATPLVPCPMRGNWVEPGLYCTVTYQEWTRTRQLRAPVFKELVEE